MLVFYFNEYIIQVNNTDGNALWTYLTPKPALTAVAFLSKLYNYKLGFYFI